LTPLEIIAAKRAHLARIANQAGAAGERDLVLAKDDWITRPKGSALKTLLAALAEAGVVIRPSSFDALAIPKPIDFTDLEAVRECLSEIVFIEIKTANQARVRKGFSGFFFALTEGEIAAAEQLGARHRVALFNNLTGELQLTSVAEIVARSRSMTWQLSVQL
jgi:hypothetical protein